MKNIPILIVHKGDSFYLEEVLRHVRLFNPENRICLISDPSTNHYDFVEHFNIEMYMESAKAFEARYVHLSINPYDYELICFQRWFIIKDFIEQQNLEHFLCLDSDVLMYCNINETLSSLVNYDFTVCDKMGLGVNLFNKRSIVAFCSFMMDEYADQEKAQALKNKYGNICDMILFLAYQDKVSKNVFDLAKTIDGACFDTHIKDSFGYEMNGKFKRIYWIDDRPYGKHLESGKYVRFNLLHFQGGAKHKMHKYLMTADKKHDTSLSNKLKWMLSPKRLKSRRAEIKKLFSSKEMFIYMMKSKLRIK